MWRIIRETGWTIGDVMELDELQIAVIADNMEIDDRIDEMATTGAGGIDGAVKAMMQEKWGNG